MKAALLPLALILAGGAWGQEISAVLEPVQSAEIRATVAGRVAALHAREGDDVDRGAPLLDMDGRVQAARVELARVAALATGAVDRAEIALGRAEAVATRMRRARERGAAQAWEVEEAEQSVALFQADLRIVRDDARRAEAQLALEEATLAEFRVAAPFDATVLETFVEEGENVDTDTAIMEVGRLDMLEATAFLPAEALSRLAVADLVLGAVDAPSGPIDAQAAVAAIDPRIDPVSRTVRVTLTLPNPDGAFASGSAFVFPAP